MEWAISFQEEKWPRVENFSNPEILRNVIHFMAQFLRMKMTDGIKNRDEEVKTEVLDIAEIIAKAIQ